MRLHVLSDLHLEREPFSPPAVEADAVVLAGDIAIGTRGVRWARECLTDRPALYVAGNHEFYGHRMPDILAELRAETSGSAVQLLENEAVVIGGVRFLGCTLWSDFDFDGAERREESMRVAERFVNDFKHIRVGPDGRSLTPGDARALHLASRRWLSERLAEPHEGETVVITHHVPLIRGRPQRTLMRALAGAFASDLTELMGAQRTALWVFGHVHRATDVEVRGTRVLSNPRGYPREHVPGFDPALVVDVG